MIQSHQDAVMAQLRRIFYCWINLAITLIAHRPPYYRHKLRGGGSTSRFRTVRAPKTIGIRTMQDNRQEIARKSLRRNQRNKPNLDLR
jgi:hypothetical protein